MTHHVAEERYRDRFGALRAVRKEVSMSRSLSLRSFIEIYHRACLCVCAIILQLRPLNCLRSVSLFHVQVMFSMRLRPYRLAKTNGERAASWLNRLRLSMEMVILRSTLADSVCRKLPEPGGEIKDLAQKRLLSNAASDSTA